MSSEFKNVSAVVLSAGKSERAGFHKALLRMKDGTLFIEKIVDEFLAFGCQKVIVVVSDSLKDEILKRNVLLPKKVCIVVNPDPERGRLSSLQMGLEKCESGFCFFHNIDNPFINTDTLQKLFDQKNEQKAVIPSMNKKAGHPVLLGKMLIDEIVEISDMKKEIREILKGNSTFVDVNDEKIFCNINTPDDYLKYTGHAIPGNEPNR
ncbi:MAG: nucleotidyltransferase family protein [Bacteroidota bacterium]